MNKHSGRVASVVASATVLVVGGALFGPQASAWAAERIGGDRITDNTIDSGEIQNESLTSADVDNGTIRSVDIRNGSVAHVDMGAGSVDAVNVRDASLRGRDIEDGTLTGADLENGTVGAEDLSPGVSDSILETLKRGSGVDSNGQRVNRWAPGDVNWDAYNEVQIPTANSLVILDAKTVSGEAPARVTFTDATGSKLVCVAVPAGGFEGTCSATRQVAQGNGSVQVDGNRSVSVEVNVVKVG